MEFQRINRTDPERVFVVVKNTYSTASLSANQWVAWDVFTDNDGVAVTKPTVALQMCLAGVAVETVANGDYGLIQVWGYRSGARCSGGSGLNTSKVSSGGYLYMKTNGFAVHALHTLASTVTIKPWQLDKVGHFIVPTSTAAKVTSATTWVGNVFIKCL